MPINPFGWNNNEAPPISAGNLEAMLQDAGHYTDLETTRAEGVEATLAPLASPALTGIPTAPTASSATNSTQLATTAFVKTVASGVTSFNTRQGGVTLTTADIAAASNCIVDSPDFHGAKHDGTTDDTAAIKAAINNAVALAQANGSNYAEVWFSPAVYFVGGALDKTQLGNSQIPLPNIGTHATVPKVILVLKGIADGSGLPHFEATSPFRSGTILLSNLNAPYDATYGWPSILGGPTPEQNTGMEGGLPIHSNMLVVIDGLFVTTNYTNPSCMAVDMSTVIELNIKSLGINADVTPPTFVAPTNISIGIQMPTHGNQLNVNVDSLSVEAFYYGVIVGEAMNAKTIRCVYCHTSISISGGTEYGSRIEHLLTEVNTYSIDSSGAASNTQLDVGTWNDNTSAATFSLNDPHNNLLGSANFNGTGQTPKVNGGANYRMTQVDVQRGSLGTFTMSTSGTPFTTIWRDATFYFSPIPGFSNINVGGANVGLITNGAVRVPSGYPLYVSYSGSAPKALIILD